MWTRVGFLRRWFVSGRNSISVLRNSERWKAAVEQGDQMFFCGKSPKLRPNPHILPMICLF
jgi:hypothetical protein